MSEYMGLDLRMPMAQKQNGSDCPTVTPQNRRKQTRTKAVGRHKKWRKSGLLLANPLVRDDGVAGS
ncbi:MAG: hypothetical protein E5X80_30970 [Mesorhizobium sp.]|uniref:hypothetical protein n=1 Tax=Mesorhizobium sp. TaxID=1871066 RepID=UPI0011F507B8|nr:hypothetical protein [Mesorhizobium sp.]TIO47865.1 MAG: hypothetical protein E5X78_31395 [Mesorhizobium sp.]TIO56084.1 MAG: hypothetical protein E5X79_32095 [Mesorhizobium sp.]TJV57111.1 MAG: hypothetical protein E5X80_30970 [Mesorhizobium sp.]